MKIGVIVKDEKYWSLQKIGENVLNCLKNNYEVRVLRLENNAIKNQKELDDLYENCDRIIYMASKLIVFKRSFDKPTFFFTYAWMDHGAGINFYLNEKAFKRNDVLLFSSSAAKKKFDQVFLTNIKSVVVPYFALNKKIKLKKIEEKDLRIRYGISEDCKILIYFGRFSSEKNIEALFALEKKIQSKNFVILAVGAFSVDTTFGFGEMDESAYEEKIEDMMAAEKSGKVVFIHKLENKDLRRLISIAFMSINPTLCLEENFNLATVESMSAGVPVIASNWGGLKDIIRSKQDGFLIRTFFSGDNRVKLDIGEAAYYIDKLLSGKVSRDALSNNALDRCKKFFSEEAFLENIELLLVKVNKKKIFGGKTIIYPKQKYELIYNSALKSSSVKTIYLDNPRLFKDLYKNYLGDNK